MRICAWPSQGRGGGGVLEKAPGHTKCVMYATFPNIEYLVLGGWMVTCVHHSFGGRGANQEYPLPPSQIKTLHATIAHVYAVMLITWGLPMSVHIGRRACALAWPRRGVGGGVEMNTPTHAKCSRATLWHTNPPCVPLSKFWQNKQAVLADHALCLSGRKLAYILHRSQNTYRSILNFNNCQKEACRAAVEEWKEPPARGMLLTLDRLVQSRKVYS